LGWDEQVVQAAVSEGRLYGIEISGRLRFPSWQFNLASSGKVLPGLAELLEVIPTWWDWESVAAFMATPQSALMAEGRQTPVAYLRDGGEVNDVTEIVESDEWW
jgi:hypothetical protein